MTGFSWAASKIGAPVSCMGGSLPTHLGWSYEDPELNCRLLNPVLPLPDVEVEARSWGQRWREGGSDEESQMQALEGSLSHRLAGPCPFCGKHPHPQKLDDLPQSEVK